jgi:hypothetical protein
MHGEIRIKLCNLIIDNARCEQYKKKELVHSREAEHIQLECYIHGRPHKLHNAISFIL